MLLVNLSAVKGAIHKYDVIRKVDVDLLSGPLKGMATQIANGARRGRQFFGAPSVSELFSELHIVDASRNTFTWEITILISAERASLVPYGKAQAAIDTIE